MLTDTLKQVTVFNERGSMSLQALIADSARLLFRFTPNTCPCLEPDFAKVVRQVTKDLGEDKILVVVAAEGTKDVRLFHKRTNLSCPVYGTSDTLSPAFSC